MKVDVLEEYPPKSDPRVRPDGPVIRELTHYPDAVELEAVTAAGNRLQNG